MGRRLVTWLSVLVLLGGLWLAVLLEVGGIELSDPLRAVVPLVGVALPV